MTTTPDTPIRCPLCGTESPTLQYPSAPDYISGDVFQVWQCRACEVAFTHPQPADLEPYYPSRYRHYRPLVLWALKQLYSGRLRGWTRAFRQPGYALEIGCGEGFMLHLLKQAGWEVLGTERTAE